MSGNILTHCGSMRARVLRLVCGVQIHNMLKMVSAVRASSGHSRHAIVEWPSSFRGLKPGTGRDYGPRGSYGSPPPPRVDERYIRWHTAAVDGFPYAVAPLSSTRPRSLRLVFRPYAAVDSPEFGYGGRMGMGWHRSLKSWARSKTSVPTKTR